MSDVFDLVNAAFEYCGAAIIWLNIVQLAEDKQIKGIDWRVLVFWCIWGGWSVLYFSHLDQTHSFLASCVVLLADFVYMCQLCWYTLNKKQES